MKIKTVIAFLVLPLPSFIKVFVYRLLPGYTIERDVRIGLSLILTTTCRIGRGTRIGHFNYIAKIKTLEIGEHVSIGHFNILQGGHLVDIGDGALIGRFNEINSILNPLVRGAPTPELIIKRRAIITAWHKIDYTDRVVFGESVVFAGRNSNVWTHNRQDCAPVSIGGNCYVGSGVQMVPGSRVGRDCIVGLGAVITKSFDDEGVLLGGIPATVIKPLDEEGRKLVTFPTRPDLDGYVDTDKSNTQ